MASCSAFGLMPTEGLLPGPAHLALRLHQWLISLNCLKVGFQVEPVPTS
jgi:hypothetical protein